jgi:hypothetical protein
LRQPIGLAQTAKGEQPLVTIKAVFLLLISRSVALSFLPASLISDWLLLSSSAF